MIEWQGPVPLTERLASCARLYRRALLVSLFMFVLISVMNILSWIIWKAEADVLLSPVFASWTFFYLMLIDPLLRPSNHPAEPGRLGVLGTGVANLPVAFLTTNFLQTPALFAQASIAKLASSALP